MPQMRRLGGDAVHSASGSLGLANDSSPAWPPLECVLIADAVPLFRDGLARLAEVASPGVRVEQSGTGPLIWEDDKLLQWLKSRFGKADISAQELREAIAVLVAQNAPDPETCDAA